MAFLSSCPGSVPVQWISGADISNQITGTYFSASNPSMHWAPTFTPGNVKATIDITYTKPTGTWAGNNMGYPFFTGTNDPITTSADACAAWCAGQNLDTAAKYGAVACNADWIGGYTFSITSGAKIGQNRAIIGCAINSGTNFVSGSCNCGWHRCIGRDTNFVPIPV